MVKTLENNDFKLYKSIFLILIQERKGKTM
jgi:hypothetical protein